MHSDPKIDIVVERQWHAPSLSNALSKHGMLGHVHTGFPRQRYLSAGVPAEFLRCNPLPALWNYAIHRLHLPHCLSISEPEAMARFYLSRTSVSPVVTCFATSYQFIFPHILDRPILRVIECGSMHPEDHFMFQQRARREAGLSFTSELPSKVKNEIAISKQAHLLVCGSRMVAESYISRGYKPERVIVCPYGVDTEHFEAIHRAQATGRPIRIATVGIIGIRKGIHRLLKIAAWARQRNIKLEFHLIGPIEPEAETMLAGRNAHFVRHGVLKGANLVQALHNADLYCLPSYEEGFPISQLEAMSTGLPAITSADTGGREAVTNGLNGMVLTQFDEEEFDTMLRPLFEDSQRIVKMGDAAAIHVRDHYSLECYTERTAALYRDTRPLIDRILSGEKLSPCHDLDA